MASNLQDERSNLELNTGYTPLCCKVPVIGLSGRHNLTHPVRPVRYVLVALIGLFFFMESPFEIDVRENTVYQPRTQSPPLLVAFSAAATS